MKAENREYIQLMIDSGRYEVARRSLAALPDDPETQALWQAIAEYEGEEHGMSDAQQAAEVRTRFAFESQHDLQTCTERLQHLQQPGQAIAPRWQRRLLLHLQKKGDGIVYFQLRTRARGHYEWRYVPATASGRLEASAEGGTRIIGHARADRRYVGLSAVGAGLALLLFSIVLFFSVAVSYATSFFLLIVAFYLLPSLMRHARHVRDSLVQQLQAALQAESAPPAPLEASAALDTELASDPATLHERLLKLHQRSDCMATDWPHRLRLQSQERDGRVLFRLQAMPIAFWDWLWNLPDISGKISPSPAGSQLELWPNMRDDLLLLMNGALLLAVGILSSLAQAALILRIITALILAVLLVANALVARASMKARNAQLAAVLLKEIKGED